MTLNFPASPIPGHEYEAPNGVTYIWNDSIQSWVVKSINYDGEYVNRVGDTMTGNLNFNTSSSPIGLDWGGNPKLVFASGGNTQLVGNYVVTGGFTFESSGINFTNDDTTLLFKNSRRMVFTPDRTAISYGGTMYMTLSSDGAQYYGNFIQPKNVTTVEYVASEIKNVQDQIDIITNDLESTIDDILNDKAVLIDGDQTINGIKTFTDKAEFDVAAGGAGEGGNGTTDTKFLISGSKGGPKRSFFWVSDNGVVNARSKDSYNNINYDYINPTLYPDQVVNVAYANYQYIKEVKGDSVDNTTSTGIIVTDKIGDGGGRKDNGSIQTIKCRKATINRYGVNLRGLLPQGNNPPSNPELQVGQMYFVKQGGYRVLIRVN